MLYLNVNCKNQHTSLFTKAKCAAMQTAKLPADGLLWGVKDIASDESSYCSVSVTSSALAAAAQLQETQQLHSIKYQVVQ